MSASVTLTIVILVEILKTSVDYNLSTCLFSVFLFCSDEHIGGHLVRRPGNFTYDLVNNGKLFMQVSLIPIFVDLMKTVFVRRVRESDNLRGGRMYIHLFALSVFFVIVSADSVVVISQYITISTTANILFDARLETPQQI